MDAELRAQIRALGPELSLDMLRGTNALFAARFGGVDPRTQISRDFAYGPHERHRLDIFCRDGARDAPVLVFVHGGGFVQGDKRSAETPFYDNIGDFAARHGMVGVTVTYRLAPAATWPSGAEDMAAIVDWLHENVAQHGGDPRRIFLMGQSAGAVHVASYVAQAVPRIAGALMISGVYDVAAADANPMHKAYYGEDASRYAAASTADALIASELPLLFSVSEYDAADFQKQAAALVGAWGAKRGTFPRMLYLAGHNHLSPAIAVGGPEDALGLAILDFIRDAIEG